MSKTTAFTAHTLRANYSPTLRGTSTCSAHSRQIEGVARIEVQASAPEIAHHRHPELLGEGDRHLGGRGTRGDHGDAHARGLEEHLRGDAPCGAKDAVGGRDP